MNEFYLVHQKMNGMRDVVRYIRTAVVETTVLAMRAILFVALSKVCLVSLVAFHPAVWRTLALWLWVTVAIRKI